MKVAVIAPTDIPSIRANSVQVMKMTQAFATLGHHVLLIIPNDPEMQQGADRTWVSLAKHYGLQNQFPMEWLPVKSGLRKYDYAWNAVRWAGSWGADVIYTRLPQAAALAANQGYAAVFEIHDRPQGIMTPMLLRLFFRGRGSQRLIVISQALAADLIDEYQFLHEPLLMKVLPDGVDLQRYVGLPPPEESRELLSAELINQDSKSQFSPERFTAGYTGHLYPGRGASLILEIAARIPEMNFLIVGGEPKDVNRVQERVLERNLNNVTLTGFIPNADLPRYQSACDVLLMPYQAQVSASSGGDIGRYLSPMKMFEYLACGRAICSSDLEVLKEILSSEIAMLLPPRDVDLWVAAIRELIDNPSLRKDMAVKASAAAKNYSWEARAEKILSGIHTSDER
ncbi:MAG: glycosyltransferase family 4 protein [Anaerolineales bacterium]